MLKTLKISYYFIIVVLIAIIGLGDICSQVINSVNFAKTQQDKMYLDRRLQLKDIFCGDAYNAVVFENQKR